MRDKIDQAFDVIISFCKLALVLLILIPIAYCSFSGTSEEERAEKRAAIEAEQRQAWTYVQNANSAVEDVSVLQYIQSLLTISQQSGNRVDIDGWSAQKAGEEYHVWFFVKENGEETKLHWTIKTNGLLQGVDKTSREILPDQTVEISGLF